MFASTFTSSGANSTCGSDSGHVGRADFDNLATEETFRMENGAFLSISTHSNVNRANAVGNVYDVFKERKIEYGRVGSVSAIRNGQFDGVAHVIPRLGVRLVQTGL